jgi:SAM-dependent methyltransferase
MAQNIYDQREFFRNYSRLSRSVSGLDGAAEWPALRAMLPDMRGLRVIDLGCGFGWFCRWAREQGAARVLGLDLSENMLARARSLPMPGITYEKADLEGIKLPEGGFDLTYSSLAFHYIGDIGGLFAAVHRAVVPGGRFVFSMEHPIYMAPAKPGWTTDADGRRSWLLNQYFAEGPRVTDWLAPGVVKYHRTMTTILTLLLRVGFTLRLIEEFRPTNEQLSAQPDLAQDLERPIFVMIAADR